MAVTITQTPSGRTSTSSSSELKLPAQKTTPSSNLADYLLFIYGQKKVGKSTLGSQFPSALHMFLEPGGKGISTYSVEPADWKQLKQYIQLLSGPDGSKFENVIVDTIDIAWELCMRDYCEANGVRHTQEMNDFGRSTDLVRQEFSSTMQALRHTGKGIIVISHAKEAEVKTRNQGSWTRFIPTLHERPASWLIGAADVVAYYGYYGAERRLVIDGSDLIEAGCRLKHNFRTPDGERVISIPMGVSDDEAYENLMVAFRNEQEETGSEVHGVAPALTTDLASALKARPGKK